MPVAMLDEIAKSCCSRSLLTSLGPCAALTRPSRLS